MLENLPSSIWAIAWCKLYQFYGETLNQEALDAMDAILGAVVIEEQDRLLQIGESNAYQF